MALAFTILIAGLGTRAEAYLVPILEAHGYHVRTAVGLQAVLETLSRSLDLVLLDLPSADDLAHLAMVRAACLCTLMVVGPARNDRLLVKALEQGADDYVQRPFRTDELLARIRAQLRRRERSQGFAITFGPLSLDPHGRQATHNGHPLELSPEEFALLATLAARPGHACSVTSLLEQVWGLGSRGEQELLATTVAQLRGRIERDPANPTILGGSLEEGYWLGGVSQARALNEQG